ncbi:MAG: pseudaminic acid cytidylyltransferase [Lachnospiraceae bacterium]|nr:pseudaminic acid cytidylyltransferase [Lachnospiraceae bacterium]
MANVIAVIPARGGSTRIPKKNIRLFLGKPIITYAISAALNCDEISEVMVSTDSEEIAEIARNAGAAVPFMRDANLADNYTNVNSVILDVIRRYEENGRQFDYIVCLYPTAPFVTSEQIKEAIRLMEKNNADEAKMLAAFSFPPQRGMIIGPDGFTVYKYPKYASTRSQDLETIYHDVGQLYVYRTDAFIRFNGNITEKVVPILVDENEVQDIDNEADWIAAEQKYRLLHSGNPS